MASADGADLVARTSDDIDLAMGTPPLSLEREALSVQPSLDLIEFSAQPSLDLIGEGSGSGRRSAGAGMTQGIPGRATTSLGFFMSRGSRGDGGGECPFRNLPALSRSLEDSERVRLLQKARRVDTQRQVCVPQRLCPFLSACVR